MKTVLTSFILLFSALNASGQLITLPEDFLIERETYSYALLHVKEIEQSKTIPMENELVSFPEYVITFDSTGFISALKYGFMGGENLYGFVNEPYTFITTIDKSNRYDYYMNEYMYDDQYSLYAIKIHKPMPRVIDGVYSKEHIPNKTTSVRIVDNEQSETEFIYYDDVLKYVIHYTYEIFSNEQFMKKLLIEKKTSSDNGSLISITKLKYHFYGEP